MQLSLTLSAMSIGLWWLFDRSRSGFGLGIGIATLATFVTQLLVYNGVYRCVCVCAFCFIGWFLLFFFINCSKVTCVGYNNVIFSVFNYRYTAPDFLFIRSWLPCIFFSGGITMGNIGRQLAMVNSCTYQHFHFSDKCLYFKSNYSVYGTQFSIILILALHFQYDYVPVEPVQVKEHRE